MAKYLVTRVRHQLEGITIDATSSADAIEKSRKTKRKNWSHLDSKKRKSYKASAVE